MSVSVVNGAFDDYIPECVSRMKDARATLRIKQHREI
jgi:hypothetical protein